ncbi:Eukaryotic translation initiation factor 2 subunit 2, partial [Stegodyphus mimosarum]
MQCVTSDNFEMPDNSNELSDINKYLNFELSKKKKGYNEDYTASENRASADEDHYNELGDVNKDLDFELSKKKKKKKSYNEEYTSSENRLIAEKNQSNVPSWDNDDKDYTYDELLLRVFAIMKEKDPTRDEAGKKKLIMKPPQIIRIGTKKTSFVNFLDICKMVRRAPHHVQSFLLVELGTCGSVDGNNQLIIRGRFEQRQIENVLRRYIKEYVTCHTCHSPETHLQKDTRLFFLQCETCGSRCSVATIKSGFQAVTGKRAAMR